MGSACLRSLDVNTKSVGALYEDGAPVLFREEYMKEFINKHPRLYWCVVVVLAVLAFTIITCVGFGKLERAEAAVTTDGVYYPSLKNVDFTECQYDWNAIMEKYAHCAVAFNPSDGSYCYAFTDARYWSQDSGGSAFVPYNYYYRGNSYPSIEGISYSLTLTKDCEVVTESKNSSLFLNLGDYAGYYELIGTTFDIIPNSQSWPQNTSLVYENEAKLPQMNMIHPKDYIETEYSVSAPYVSFEKLEVVNPFRSGTAKYKLFVDIYEEYLPQCRWTYYGLLNNTQLEIDLGYDIDLTLEIELPTERYLSENVFTDGMTLEKALKHSPAIIDLWDSYDGNIYNDEAEVYTIDLTLPVVPNAIGIFEMSFTYQELEYLLHKDANFHERWTALIGADDYDTIAFILAHMNVKVVKMDVKTKRSDAIYMGKGVINIFHRGEYGTCVEVAPDVDFSTMTEEEIDALIKETVDKATSDYYDELKNRVEDLQGQIDNMNGALGSFDTEYDGTSLWGAIRSVGSGLLGMTGFLTAFAGVVGGFFGFLPYDMRAIIGYLVIVGVFVVLWRLAKGK